MKREIVAVDESGTITRHYEDCGNCGGKNTLKVYECRFKTWWQVEKSCSVCLFLERKVYGKKITRKLIN
ncbi:MAG: hypothetical protein APF84_13640 [Gracilibacter sp. BRH_c7a]|nr:MAG: hypothetical protein APF84_13640 [Gracilibacter sp. BRH_c7a]